MPEMSDAVAKCLELVKKGSSVRDAAEKMNVNPTTIYSACKRHGIAYRKSVVRKPRKITITDIPQAPKMDSVIMGSPEQIARIMMILRSDA